MSVAPIWARIREVSALVALAGVLAAGHLGVRALSGEPVVWEPATEPSACELAHEEADDEPAATSEAIGVAEAIALHGRPGVVFVDARSNSLFAALHIPGALCLPLEEAPALLAHASLGLSPEDVVIAYCEGPTGDRSEALAGLLREHLGCNRVQVLEGGLASWLAQGGPIREAAAKDAAEAASEGGRG
jgi:rhodanese-related sulfurtransferase